MAISENLKTIGSKNPTIAEDLNVVGSIYDSKIKNKKMPDAKEQMQLKNSLTSIQHYVKNNPIDEDSKTLLVKMGDTLLGRVSTARNFIDLLPFGKRDKLTFLDGLSTQLTDIRDSTKANVKSATPLQESQSQVQPEPESPPPINNIVFDNSAHEPIVELPQTIEEKAPLERAAERIPDARSHMESLPLQEEPISAERDSFEQDSIADSDYASREAIMLDDVDVREDLNYDEIQAKRNFFNPNAVREIGSRSVTNTISNPNDTSISYQEPLRNSSARPREAITLDDVINDLPVNDAVRSQRSDSSDMVEEKSAHAPKS